MSYSVCLECKDMVAGYEKYCPECSKDKTKNDKQFWKTHGYEYLDEPLRSHEIKKDQIPSTN